VVKCVYNPYPSTQHTHTHVRASVGTFKDVAGNLINSYSGLYI